MNAGRPARPRQPAKGRAAAHAQNSPGLPSARLPLQSLALSFVTAHNGCDLCCFHSLLLKMWCSNPSIVEILEREINNLRHMVYSSSKALREKRQRAEVEKGRMFSRSYLSLCSFS